MIEAAMRDRSIALAFGCIEQLQHLWRDSFERSNSRCSSLTILILYLRICSMLQQIKCERQMFAESGIVQCGDSFTVLRVDICCMLLDELVHESLVRTIHSPMQHSSSFSVFCIDIFAFEF